MKLGAEPKKVAILAVLLLVAAISAWMNFFGESTGSPPSNSASTPPRPSATAQSAGGSATTQSAVPRGGLVRGAARAQGNQGLGEFRPVFKSERRGQALDPTKVDPTLRTDLLEKLREVRLSGPGRNLFQFGQAPPPPKPPEPKIIPKPEGSSTMAGVDPSKPIEPVKPPPPPIPLRYYGFADPRQDGEKRAFFMEGEEIRIAAEGEFIKQRFKVLQIGPKSAVVEDTEHENKQTLAIQPETGS